MMSYCRWGWDGSDVYVFESSSGFVCCCGPGCESKTPEEMIVHLASHRRNGGFVPAYAIEGLWHDIPGAKEPVERDHITMAARERLAQAKKLLPPGEIFTPYVQELRRELGRCGECGREKPVP